MKRFGAWGPPMISDPTYVRASRPDRQVQDCSRSPRLASALLPRANNETDKLRRASAHFPLPNAGDKPPSNPRSIICVARKLYLKNSVLRDRAMEQERQAEDHKERAREPRSERGSACRDDQDPRGVSWMADEGVRSRGDNALATVGLDAND